VGVMILGSQDLFRLHPLFGALTDGETRELLKCALIKRVAAGDVVFRKDDPGDGLYGVLTGSVLIVVESLEGKDWFSTSTMPVSSSAKLPCWMAKGAVRQR
jgi:signal-transduction protein with cAMP-binding, CBS, and nucleotidyltransferase domain